MSECGTRFKRVGGEWRTCALPAGHHGSCDGPIEPTHRPCVEHDGAHCEVCEQPWPCPSAPTERPAQPGELCTCGRQAITVFISAAHGEVGYCGLPDGGARTTPCVFCGEDVTHDFGRCPEYRLRPGGAR